MLSPEQITAIAYHALEDKKAKDVKILKTAEHTVLADYFVICNGSSSAHIKALVEEVDKKLSEAGEPPLRREGQSCLSCACRGAAPRCRSVELQTAGPDTLL